MCLHSMASLRICAFYEVSCFSNITVFCIFNSLVFLMACCSSCGANRLWVLKGDILSGNGVYKYFAIDEYVRPQTFPLFFFDGWLPSPMWCHSGRAWGPRRNVYTLERDEFYSQRWPLCSILHHCLHFIPHFQSMECTRSLFEVMPQCESSFSIWN